MNIKEEGEITDWHQTYSSMPYEMYFRILEKITEG